MKVLMCDKIIPVTRKIINQGHIFIENGKITKVGEGYEVPQGAEIIDAKDMIAFPGIIDAHSHASVFEEEIGFHQDGNESTDPITPQVRVIDAINPKDRGLRRAVSGGVTCICVAPGSANVVGGHMTTIKTHGMLLSEMIVTQKAGIKCAFGENPKRVYGAQKKMPNTRMGNLAVFRQFMVDVQNYMAKWDAYNRKMKVYLREQKENEINGDKEKPSKLSEPSIPERNLKYEAMIDVFQKKIPLRAHAHQANDIVTAVELAKEFDVNIIIEHCSEGHQIIDYLLKNQIPALIGPTFSHRSKIETRFKTWTTLGKLYKAGLLVGLTSDHPVSPLQFQTVYAAIAHREGLSEQGAFEVLTINGAKILGIENRVGSIEVGKDADIVLFEGHPLDTRSKISKVFINGNPVFDRLRDKDENLF
ncbi:amidohydrolase [Candidatus Lokiarchaeum ossiferum]|uniref:amidohydrolase n=1 Tax=Candidatus Lokiarchaeum ossiferum TaxID=2951803 RepID=UPI00352F5194